MKLKTSKRDHALVLTLTGREMTALEHLAIRKGQTKSAVLRQALRLYESLETRVAKGERLVLEAPDKGEKAEVLLL